MFNNEVNITPLLVDTADPRKDEELIKKEENLYFTTVAMKVVLDQAWIFSKMKDYAALERLFESHQALFSQCSLDNIIKEPCSFYAAYGHVDKLVQALREKPPLAKMLGRILVQVVWNSQLEVLKVLLNHPTFHEISQQDKNEALTKAISKGCLDMVVCLLTMGKGNVGSALSIAAKNERVEAVLFLIFNAKHTLSKVERGAALIDAVLYGHERVVSLLLVYARQEILPGDTVVALWSAATKRYPKVVKAVLDFAGEEIALEEKNRVFEAMRKEGYLEIEEIFTRHFFRENVLENAKQLTLPKKIRRKA